MKTNIKTASLYAKSLVALSLVAGLAGCVNDENNQTASQVQNPIQNKNPIPNQADGLTLVTWNIENFGYPVDAGCRPRTAQEIAELKTYAATINADIVAMQEVHSSEAVHQIFPKSDWQVVMSQRPDNEAFDCRNSNQTSTQQKVAFAVKKGLNIENIESKPAFGLNSRGLRHGLEIVVGTEFGSMSLLNVHMKSGCFVDDYSSSGKRSCQTYAQQAPILDDYIEQKDALNQPFVVLGDFNHRLAEASNVFAKELAVNDDGTPLTVFNATRSLVGCHEYYPAPIDHILVGKVNLEKVSFEPKVFHYKDMEPSRMLSDHCAVTVTLTSK